MSEKHPTTVAEGVRPFGSRFQAVCRNGKRIVTVGYFDTVNEAIEARKQYKHIHGLTRKKGRPKKDQAP